MSNDGKIIADAFEDMAKAMFEDMAKTIVDLQKRVARLEKWQKDECSI